MGGSNSLWSQRDYFTPALIPQITRYNTTYSRANQLVLLVDQNSGIVVKADETTVWTHNRSL